MKDGNDESTMLHIMGTLDRPTSGAVFIMGRASSSSASLVQYPPSGEARREATQLLKEVGLENRLQHNTGRTLRRRATTGGGSAGVDAAAGLGPGR